MGHGRSADVHARNAPRGPRRKIGEGERREAGVPEAFKIRHFESVDLIGKININILLRHEKAAELRLELFPREAGTCNLHKPVMGFRPYILFYFFFFYLSLH